jgi:hypothetical protein
LPHATEYIGQWQSSSIDILKKKGEAQLGLNGYEENERKGEESYRKE